MNNKLFKIKNKIVNNFEIIAIEIKKDIFGREIFEGDLGKVPLTKLKRDICKSVGVL